MKQHSECVALRAPSTPLLHEYIRRVTRSPPVILKQRTLQVHSHFEGPGLYLLETLRHRNHRLSTGTGDIHIFRVVRSNLFCCRLKKSMVRTISRAPLFTPGNVFNHPLPSGLYGNVQKLFVLHPTSLLRCVRYKNLLIPYQFRTNIEPPPQPSRKSPTNQDQPPQPPQ